MNEFFQGQRISWDDDPRKQGTITCPVPVSRILTVRWDGSENDVPCYPECVSPVVAVPQASTRNLWEERTAQR